ncbi:IS66 family transposase [Pseudofulvimonas gallinarii]
MDWSMLDDIDDPVQLREAAQALLSSMAATVQTTQHDHERACAERDAALETVARQRQVVQERDRAIVLRDARIAALTTEIARLRRLQFTARSERMTTEQRDLFEETMAADIAAVEAELAALQAHSPSPSQPPRPRLSPKRQPLAEHLPRIETRHEPATCTCPQCHGDLVHISDQVSERLACKPPVFYVKRDIYPQYACRACEQVVAEPVAAALIDRGQADASLLAQVVIAKYVDHLPLYRQQAIYARSGVELSRSTLAEWVGAVGVALQPLADRLAAQLREQAIVHADETPVALLDPKAGKTRRAYLWLFRNAHYPGADPPRVVFQFHPNRSGDHARQFLKDWRGSLMVDEYSGYKGLWSLGITELACWAHVRRKWFDQHKASGSPIAAEALARIGVLYRIEREAATMTVEERLVYRQRCARPVLDALKTWLDGLQHTVMGQSGTAKALAYTLRRWDALVRYVDNGASPIDNNLAENAIRPIALGRKNWLFAGSEQAGRRAAAIMSLLATAKANGIEPHAWLENTLTHLPTTLNRDIDSLLPLRRD